MHEPEQLIVPALGVLVLLSVFILGSATHYYFPAYLVTLGLLGLAAVGTYFPPPAVQVELRVGIAALGLMVALIFMFRAVGLGLVVGFGLALMGFGTIGILQIRHRQSLQTQLHTIEWLKTLRLRILQSWQTRASAIKLGADEEGDESGRTTAGHPRAFRVGGSMNIGGIGAAILGIVVLCSAMMPWAIGAFYFRFSGWMLIENQADPFGVLGAIVALLSIVGIASIVLPRIVPAIAGVLGVLVMLLTYLAVSSEIGGVSSGFWVATLAFLSMAVLQLIPRQRN